MMVVLSFCSLRMRLQSRSEIMRRSSSLHNRNNAVGGQQQQLRPMHERAHAVAW